MRYTRIFAMLTWIGVLLCSSVSAGTAQSVGGSIQQRYKQMQTMHASFTQELRHKESGSVETRSGVLLFKAPRLLRWSTMTPSPELLIINAEAVWNYFEDEGVVYKYPPALVHETRTALRFITGDANIDEEFFVESGVPANGLTPVVLVAKEPTTDLTEATLWVDDGAVVHRILTVDFYGNENDIRLTDVRFDEPLSDNDFAFTPPPGVDVEDRTQQVREEKLDG